MIRVRAGATRLAVSLALTAGLIAGTPALAPTAQAADLTRFTGQELSWQPCGTAECAHLIVPMDYGNPADGELSLALIRKRHRGESSLGSLLVNPGGPGTSGLGMAEYLASVAPKLRNAYDIVAFDPRGVGASTPITCLTGVQTTRWLLTDPTPDTAAEVGEFMQRAGTIASGCEQRAPRLARQIGTDNTVRDLEVMRAVLGDRTLNLLGFSYGTALATRYAELFPDRVGRFVLDGPLNLALDGMGLSRGQARGFDDAFWQFALDCPAHADCVADTPSGVVGFTNRMVRTVDRQPLRGDSGPVNEAQVLAAIFRALYSASDWPRLRTALAETRHGSGAMLQRMANEAWDRTGPNTYDSNANSAFYAISCWDLPAPPGARGLAAAAGRWAREARVPALAIASSWGNAPCTHWFGHGSVRPHRADSSTTAPILIIGTLHDPATPYAWAVSMSQQLPTSRLLTYEGNGHTAFGGESACIDAATTSYLLTGSVPPPGTRCR